MSIASELSTLAANKAAIKAAIVAKSPATSPGDNMADWPAAIASIPSGGGSGSGEPTFPNDGKTRFVIELRDRAYHDFRLAFKQSVANGVTIDWGDGTTPESDSTTSQATRTHIYNPSSYPAEYTITLTVNGGTLSLDGALFGWNSITATQPVSAYGSMLKYVSFGNIKSLGNYVFCYCIALQSISLPSGVTSIGTSAFYNCQSLHSISFPSGLTSIGGSAFSSCHSLHSISLPSGVTSIGGTAFYNCHSLQSISLPSGVTSIGINTLNNCQSLQSISFPSGLTSIAAGAFNSAVSCKIFDFSGCTAVPTLSNTNAFSITPDTKYIVVPDSLYDTWKAANNWNSSTNNIVSSIIKKSAFDALTL